MTLTEFPTNVRSDLVAKFIIVLMHIPRLPAHQIMRFTVSIIGRPVMMLTAFSNKCYFLVVTILKLVEIVQSASYMR